MNRFILYIILLLLSHNVFAQTNGNKAIICPGDTLYLSAKSFYADYYKWYHNGSYFRQTNTNSVMITDVGAYSVVAFNNYGCESDESEKVIVVKKAMYALDDSAFVHKYSTVKIPVLHNDLPACSPFDTNSIKIFLQPWQGSIAKRRNGVLEYIPNDNAGGIDQFTYRVYDTAGDESNLAYVTVYIGTECGIVYPNPVTNLVNVRVYDDNIKYVRLCDVAGQVLQADNIGVGTKQMNMGGYADGMYIIQLLDSRGRTVCSFKVLSENGH